MGRNLHMLSRWIIVAWCSILLTACGGVAPADRPATAALPTPTIAALFRATTPTSVVSTAVPSSPTLAAPSSVPAANAPHDATQFKERAVFDEELNPKWELTHSDGMEYNPAADQYVSSGQVALAVTPTKDFGTLFFTVSEQSDEQFPRARVLGLRFWLNGGPEGIRTSDLAVAVVGSNERPFWAKNDTSVTVTGRTTQDMPLFPETRLYYLGINRDIPPEAWAKVEVWLDDLKFEPDYTYVTGFYLKNDQDVRAPFYLDHVSLLVAP